MAINGHTHIDAIYRVGGIPYYHVNSASYYWVGGKRRHLSLSKSIHEKYKTIEYTCPYERGLFTEIILDPDKNCIEIRGRSTKWIGDSPSELNLRYDALTDREEIVPLIRSRNLRGILRKS